MTIILRVKPKKKGLMFYHRRQGEWITTSVLPKKRRSAIPDNRTAMINKIEESANRIVCEAIISSNVFANGSTKSPSTTRLESQITVDRHWLKTPCVRLVMPESTINPTMNQSVQINPVVSIKMTLFAYDRTVIPVF